MKLLNKILSFISVFLLIFYQVSFPLAVLAQESTPSASVESASNPSPTPTPFPTTEASSSASPTPEPSPVPASDWQDTVDKAATTKDNVVTNHLYTAPQDDKVTVKFNKLPDNKGKLTIKEVTLSDEQVSETKALSNIAYDISSTMENGTFEYTLTLTLPTPKTENVEVKASENGQTFVTLGGVTAQTDTLTITGLNHFTIFVITGTITTSEPFTATTFDESATAVVINEFVFNPSSGNEWVELYNTGSSSVDLTGWRLEDGNSINDDLTLSGTIPATGILVFEHSSGWLNNPSASGAGDVITLKNALGTEISKVTYRREANGTIVNGAPVSSLDNINVQNQSIGRTNDGVPTAWQVFSTPTKGYNNSGNLTFLNVGSIYPYQSIQEGIDAIAVGGTVNVAPGNYNESVNINKSLTLNGDTGDSNIGPGPDAPIVINGDCWRVINVNTSNVTIQGFVLDGDGCGYPVVRIANNRSEVTIQDNELFNNSKGVDLSPNSHDNIVSNNLIHDNDGYGVWIGGSTNNIISGNEIYDNGTGIGLGEGGCGGNNESGAGCVGDISGNEITGNNNIHDNDGEGIYVDSGVTFSDLTINNNTVSANGVSNVTSGIYIGGVTNSSDTLSINGNDVLGNGYHGIYIGSIINSTVNIGSSGANTIENNNEAGLYIENIDQDSTVNIKNNTINGNNTWLDYAGVYLGPINQSVSTVNIQDNSISNNFGEGLYVNSIQDSTLNVAGNTIDHNTTQGIYLEQASGSEITIGGSNTGESNTITNNDDAGIYLGGVTGVNITGNTVQNNGLLNGAAGIVVNNAQENQAHNNIISGNNIGVANFAEANSFDARENWWGATSGPEVEDTNPDGEGDVIEGIVSYRPFYTDETQQTLSTLNIDPADLANLVNTGVFSLPEGESSNSVTIVTVEEKLSLTVDDNGNQNTVFLPVGTTIQRSDGLPLDIADLTADDVDESSLSGLGTGTVIDGALQWGIPSLGLVFSQPITLNIYVGISLNGQILDVKRSVSGIDDWTDDGIETPATCTVAAGICTFQATKASYYATTRTVTTSSTSTTQALSSASGGGTAPTCNDAYAGGAPTLLSATVSGPNQVTLIWSKALDPVTHYVVSYGLVPGNPLYGNPSVGDRNTTTYTVSNLSGGITYYFRVRAGNGCNGGPYSNELAVKTTGGVVVGPAAGFAPGVLGITSETGNVGVGEDQGQIQGEATESTQTSPTTKPQPSAQSPFNAKVVLVIVVVLLLGFGVFKLRY